MESRRSFFDFSKRGWQFITLFLLGLTWGSSFILMKFGLESFTSIEVASMRMSFAFLFILPFVLPKLRHVPRHRFRYLTLAGFLGNGIPAFLFATAQQHIDSSLSAILNSTAPIFTLIVGATLFELRFKRIAGLGVVIGLIGTIYLISTKVDLSNWNDGIVYASLPLLGSICYGFSTNIIKKNLKDLTAVVVTGGALCFVGPPCIVIMLSQGILHKISTDPFALQNAGLIVVLGVVGTSTAVLIFNYLIKHTTVLFAASVTYLIPVFAMGWGAIFGEDITVHYFLGMAIILFGIWLTNRGKK